MPASLLTTGDNVIAVETHVNYTRSATVGMWASVIRVDGTPESTSGDDDVKPEPEPQPPLAEDITLDMLAEHEARLCMLELTTTATI